MDTPLDIQKVLASIDEVLGSQPGPKDVVLGAARLKECLDHSAPDGSVWRRMADHVRLMEGNVTDKTEARLREILQGVQEGTRRGRKRIRQFARRSHVAGRVAAVSDRDGCLSRRAPQDRRAGLPIRARGPRSSARGARGFDSPGRLSSAASTSFAAETRHPWRSIRRGTCARSRNDRRGTCCSIDSPKRSGVVRSRWGMSCSLITRWTPCRGPSIGIIRTRWTTGPGGRASSLHPLTKSRTGRSSKVPSKLIVRFRCLWGSIIWRGRSPGSVRRRGTGSTFARGASRCLSGTIAAGLIASAPRGRSSSSASHHRVTPLSGSSRLRMARRAGFRSPRTPRVRSDSTSESGSFVPRRHSGAATTLSLSTRSICPRDQQFAELGSPRLSGEFGEAGPRMPRRRRVRASLPRRAHGPCSGTGSRWPGRRASCLPQRALPVRSHEGAASSSRRKRHPHLEPSRAAAQQAVPSVQAQDYPAVEHIIVSDGPDENLRYYFTSAMEAGTQPEKHSIMYDGLATHDPEPHYGWRARLRGLELATGDYVGYCDNDDALRPEHCRLMAAALDADPEAGFAVSRMMSHYPGGKRVVWAGGAWSAGISAARCSCTAGRSPRTVPGGPPACSRTGIWCSNGWMQALNM